MDRNNRINQESGEREEVVEEGEEEGPLTGSLGMTIDKTWELKNKSNIYEKKTFFSLVKDKWGGTGKGNWGSFEDDVPVSFLYFLFLFPFFLTS